MSKESSGGYYYHQKPKIKQTIQTDAQSESSKSNREPERGGVKNAVVKLAALRESCRTGTRAELQIKRERKTAIKS